jgi:hypothetical protein
MKLSAPPRRGGHAPVQRNAATTAPGFTNPNGQSVIASTGAPSTTRDSQTIYHLRCNRCRHDYGCNGLDIKARLCPRCQHGRQESRCAKERRNCLISSGGSYPHPPYFWGQSLDSKRLRSGLRGSGGQGCDLSTKAQRLAGLELHSMFSVYKIVSRFWLWRSLQVVEAVGDTGVAGCVRHRCCLAVSCCAQGASGALAG